MNDYSQTQGLNRETHLVPSADAAARWPDGPVPYTLTPEAESLLSRTGPGAQRQPARSWVLTPRAEALLDSQAGPEPEL